MLLVAIDQSWSFQTHNYNNVSFTYGRSLLQTYENAEPETPHRQINHGSVLRYM